MIHSKADPGQYERAESLAFEVLQLLQAGAAPRVDAVAQSLGATLEYMLTAILEADASTRRYWIDGVVFECFAPLGPQAFTASGYAWCATDTEQWQVPAQISAEFSASHFTSLLLRLGDGEAGTLAHRRKQGHTPTENESWLFEFDIRRLE